MNASPRRIAFCITELDPGGAERALFEIVRRLDPRDWTARVYCLSGRGELVEELQAAGIPVHCLQARSRRDWGVVGRLRRELKQFGPDVLQTFLFHGNIAGRLAARGAGVPVVVSGVRVCERDARWRMRLDRWTNRLVTHNVCVSRALADQYRSLGIDESRLSVIPNGVDASRFTDAAPLDLTQWGIANDARVIAAIGRLHPQKGFDLLVEAVRPLLDEFPDLHLLIAGDGPLRDPLEQQIDSLKNAVRVHLVGRQPDVAGLLCASQLFVLSSRWEGMPNVLLEAMAAAKPVVATDVQGVRDVVQDGTIGLVVAPESSQALTDGLRQLLTDPVRAARLAAAGQQRVRSDFTWQRVVDEYVALWKHLSVTT